MSTTGTDIDIDVLRSVYNMPIEQAAKQLGVCVTVLKRICRRKGIPRWPYRKVSFFLFFFLTFICLFFD